MKLAPDAFEETVDSARGYLQTGPACGAASQLARNFAEALVQIADRCVVGVPCARHGGAVHGQEAEELRVGVEQLLKNISDVDDGDGASVLQAVRKALIFLLDVIDARDSLAFREATDPSDEDEDEAAASSA